MSPRVGSAASRDAGAMEITSSSISLPFHFFQRSKLICIGLPLLLLRKEHHDLVLAINL
jgi:hypothetical protein